MGHGRFQRLECRSEIAAVDEGCPSKRQRQGIGSEHTLSAIGEREGILGVTPAPHELETLRPRNAQPRLVLQYPPVRGLGFLQAVLPP